MTAIADHPEPVAEAPAFPAAKLAMWLFLASEVMFFSGLLAGCYVLKAGATGGNPNLWPTREQTHVLPWLGALNTLLLVASSLVLSFALRSLQEGNRSGAIRGFAISLFLGLAFLGVKSREYSDKFTHGLTPGNIAEAVTNAEQPDARRARMLSKGQRLWLDRQRGVLEDYITKNPEGNESDLKAAKAFLASLRDGKKPNGDYIRPLSPPEAAKEANRLLHENPGLPVFAALPNGNLWSSFYFTLTGLHALHLLAGLILIAICLLRALAGGFKPGQLEFAENTTLYWHFVDLVWLILFPVIYLI